MQTVSFPKCDLALPPPTSAKRTLRSPTNHPPHCSQCVCVSCAGYGCASVCARECVCVSLLAVGNVYCRSAFGPAHGRPLMDYSCQGPDTGLARQQFHCSRPSVCVCVCYFPQICGDFAAFAWKQYFSSVFLCVLSLCKLLSATSPSVLLKTQLRL